MINFLISPEAEFETEDVKRLVQSQKVIYALSTGSSFDLNALIKTAKQNNFSQPKKVPVAHEFVNTSISSGGDGKKVSKTSDRWLRNNQHIKFVENQRGYLRHQIRPSSWTAEFMSLDSVSQRHAALRVSREIYLERKINIQKMLR